MNNKKVKTKWEVEFGNTFKKKIKYKKTRVIFSSGMYDNIIISYGKRLSYQGMVMGPLFACQIREGVDK